jgi:hypothetical protein
LPGVPAPLSGKHDFAADDFTVGGLVAGGGDVEVPGALLMLLGDTSHAWIEGMAGRAARGAVEGGLELLHLELVLLLDGLETRRARRMLPAGRGWTARYLGRVVASSEQWASLD